MNALIPSKSQLRILVVDDYDDARELFAEFLELSGHQVLLARDGMEALAVAQREVPDVILMDLSLPVMDGWEASLRLKEDPRTHAVPIIALSGLSLDRNSEAVRRSGCDAFLRKPVGFVEVEAAIREVLLGVEAGLRAAASV